MRSKAIPAPEGIARERLEATYSWKGVARKPWWWERSLRHNHPVRNRSAIASNPSFARRGGVRTPEGV